MPITLPGVDNLRPALGVFNSLEWGRTATIAPPQELSWDINLGVYAKQEAAGLEPWTGTAGDEAAKRVEALIAVSKSISNLVFPSSVRERVEEFRQSDEGAMLLPWFWVPQELYGHVPQSLEFPDKINAGRTLAVIALAIASLFGQPFNYKNNPRGAGSIVSSAATLSNVLPRSLAGSGEFDLHAEVVGGEIRPDYLVFFCVRGLAHVRTFVVPPKRIIEKLSYRALSKLAEPVFVTEDGLVPNSSSTPHAVIAPMNKSERISVNFAEGFTRPFDPKDKDTVQALAELRWVLSDPDIKTVHALRRGNAFIVRNDGLHGRTAPGEPNELPRWMVRVFVRDSRDSRQKGVPFVQL